MADYYIEADAAAGGITGAGTEGDPWTGLGGDAIIQYAIDNGPWDTSGGNRLYLSTHEPYILASAVDYGAVFSGNDGADNLFAWLPWTGGTSATTTIDFPSGESVPCWELDADDAVADPVIGLHTHVTYHYGKIHSSTAQWDRGAAEHLIFCEIYGMGTTSSQIDNSAGKMYGCWIHSDGSVAGQDGCESMSSIVNCLFEGHDDKGVAYNQASGTYIGNVFYNNGGSGMSTSNADDGLIARNTFVGSGDAGEVGLHIDNSSATGNIVMVLDHLGYLAWQQAVLPHF